LELVEAQQRGVGRDTVGQRRDRVLAVRVLALPAMDAGVRVLHEAVEMDAPLARQLGRGKEQIHQHGFAPADLADQIQPVRPRLVRPVGRLAAQEAGEQRAVAARRARRRVVAAQLGPQRLQPLGGHALRGVGDQAPIGHQRPVGGQRPLGERIDDDGGCGIHAAPRDSRKSVRHQTWLIRRADMAEGACASYLPRVRPEGLDDPPGLRRAARGTARK